jgi:hypothetical protein
MVATQLFSVLLIPSSNSITATRDSLTKMTNRGEIQKQLTHILSLINAENLKLEDVMPKEMQDHFQDMIALKEARVFIKETEAREKELQAENNNLLAQLKAKQAEIDNQPEAFKTLKVDLQQAQHRIEYYKELAENSQERAERYQRKLLDTKEQQTARDDDALKIQRLQAELEHQLATNFKLSQENRTMSAHHDNLIVAKDNRIEDLVAYVSQLEREKRQHDNNITTLTFQFATEKLELEEAKITSEQVTEACETLIDSLERETSSATDVVNRRTVSHDMLYSGIIAQIVPLNRFYDHAFGVLGIYQSIFHSLAHPNSPISTSLPKSLDAMLDAAAGDLDNFTGVADMIKYGTEVQDRVRLELDDMANVAARMYNSLDAIREDVEGILFRSRNDPNTALAMKMRQRDGALGSLSATSFASNFRKRFSLG